MEGGEPRSGRKNWNIRTPPWTIELHPRNSPGSATHGNPNSCNSQRLQIPHMSLTGLPRSRRLGASFSKFAMSCTEPWRRAKHARGSFQGSRRNGTRLTQHHGFTASPCRFQGETRLGKGLDRLYLHGFEVRPEQPCHRNLGVPKPGNPKIERTLKMFAKTVAEGTCPSNGLQLGIPFKPRIQPFYHPFWTLGTHGGTENSFFCMVKAGPRRLKHGRVPSAERRSLQISDLVKPRVSF